MSGGHVYETLAQITSVKVGALPPSLFEVPVDFEVEAEEAPAP